MLCDRKAGFSSLEFGDKKPETKKPRSALSEKYSVVFRLANPGAELSNSDLDAFQGGSGKVFEISWGASKDGEWGD